jgi:Holliday junction resolvasome RuvABC ATP-dependent DNA helicase subunit
MSDLITAKEIEQWRPKTLDEVVGCEFAKRPILDALNSKSDVPNIMISGDSGSGKTCLVRLVSKGTLCLSSTNRPCGTCAKCAGVDFRFSESGLFVIGDEIVRNYHVVDCCQITQDELNATVLQLGDAGRHYVVLDEAHGLKRRHMDFRLLEAIERWPRTTWIASTSYPELLDTMFIRRFSVRVKTTRPSVEACEAFVAERCQAWSISSEKEAVSLLAHRSVQNISECIRLLVMAASTEERMLSIDMIRHFPFLNLNSDSK